MANQQSPQTTTPHECDICPGISSSLSSTNSNYINLQQLKSHDAGAADAEPHVSYLVALFQALKASGVSPDSFTDAFACLHFSTTSSNKSGKAFY